MSGTSWGIHFPKLKGIHGFVGGRILKRVVTRGIEFLIVTEWESLESIRQFAGADVTLAVVPDSVQKMMIECDDHVLHYDVAMAVKAQRPE
jgi:heme-degrading monooxygenase HmoA